MHTIGNSLYSVSSVQLGKISFRSTMAQESNTSSYSVYLSPSYAEAVECLQLSTRKLTQVMLDQQQNCLKNNRSLPIDQDDAFAKELRVENKNKIVCLIYQLAVVIFLIFILLYFV